MADNGEGEAADPTGTAGGDSGGDTAGSSQAETIARLQKELLEAAARNASEVINLVLELRRISPEAEICPVDSQKNTPLHRLMSNSGATDDIVARLVGAMTKDEMNRGNHQEETALLLAAKADRLDFVRILLEAGADMTGTSVSGHVPPLHYAARYGKVEFARVLCEHAIKHGADIDSMDKARYTPLYIACSHDQSDIVDLLASHGANMTLLRGGGPRITPFGIALSEGKTASVQALIRHGANIHASISGLLTPLSLAAAHGQKGIVQMLLDLGVDAKAPTENWTPLTAAARHRDNHEVIKLLVGHGALINERDPGGSTPLSTAASVGGIGNVTVLLGLGAEINKSGWKGRTPLAVACSNGHIQVVDLLLDMNADPRIRDADGISPLSLASDRAFEDIVSMLLATGLVHVDGTDSRGRTALHMACVTEPIAEYYPKWRLSAKRRYEQTIRLLLKHGANTGLRTTAGETLLHLAAESKQTDHLPLLLGHMRHDDIEATTPRGETALDIAVAKKSRKVVSFLLAKSVCSISMGGIDDGVLRWAAQDVTTHDIVKMKLMQDISRESQHAEIKPNWGALDVAAYLGEYVIVQQLLRGLSRSRSPVERIQHTMSILDTSNETAAAVMRPLPMGISLDKNEKAETDTNGKTHQNPEKPGDIRETLSHRQIAVRALLKVAGSSARTSNMVTELQLPTPAVEVERRHEASIFDFYSGRTVSTASRKVASVQDVVYTQGPQAIMEAQRSVDEEARSMLEGMEWPVDYESKALKAEALRELVPGQDKDFILRWVHLPVNNVKWMQDLTTRIRYDRAPTPSYRELADCGRFFRTREEYSKLRNDPSFPDLKSFFGGSWLEFPDASSPSRVMKPRCVRKDATAADSGSPVRATGRAREDPTTGDTKSGEQPASAQSNAGFQPLALYMPYLTFATQDSSMTDSMKPFTDKSEIIHGSRTLDEYHYQFASDTDFQQGDVDKRNRDQVVTRWLHRDEDISDLESWVVLRVDQLWLWIVAPDVIITSSTHRLDGRPDVVANTVFSHLQKGHSQPKTVHELADLITSTCIQFYDQTQEARPEKSMPEESLLTPRPARPREIGGLTVQEIFSNSINKVAIEEVELFETFTKDEEVTSHRKSDVPTTKKVTVVKPARLLCEVKDLQDEINILRAIVTQQQRVQEAFLGEQKGEAGMTGQIIARIDEMDKYAARIYSAVHATLGLEQNKIAIGYSNEAVRQGRNLMAFTATTILFLPLSFLASLFALDVSVFPHNDKGDVEYSPQWVFPLIFCVSAAFWAMVILYAFQDQMMAIFQVHRFRDMGKWGKGMMSRRRGRGAVEVVEAAEPLTPELKPRGLRKLGLRWRKPRQVFEEDGLSVHSISGERRPKSNGKK